MQKVKIITNMLHEYDRRFPPEGMVVTMVQQIKNLCKVDTGVSTILLPLSHVQAIETDLIDIPMNFWKTKKIKIKPRKVR